MTKMIERMARAMEATMFAPHELPCRPDLHAKYMISMKAVIEAMEEPTREMWAAGADACVTKVNVHHDKVVGDVWKAMLGAASLSET